MTGIIRGTAGSDVLAAISQDGSSVVYGLGGDDQFSVAGSSGSYRQADFVALNGNDTFDISFAFGKVFAGGGNDLIKLHSGSYGIDGDAGSDTIQFDVSLASATVLAGGSGAYIYNNSASVPLYAEVANVETFRFADVTIIQGDGNQTVDDLFYLKQNPDVAAAGMDPEIHYATYGWKEGRDPNGFFDTDAYLNANPDVRAAGINPLQHYLDYGWKEGRDPSANFDTQGYLAANPDVAAANINPLFHYLTYGSIEGRLPVGDGNILT